MRSIIRAQQRGHTDIGWLNSWHSFSFGDYYDPNKMGFRSLRVINDDIIKPGMGFGTHAHRDMEIITYVLHGALQHQDSLGNGDVLRPGDVQRMSAGSGIRHSEFNPAADVPTHLLQIWLLPCLPGGSASYEQRHYADELKTNRWCCIVSGNGIVNALPIHADANIYASLLTAKQTLHSELQTTRHGYLHVAAGSVFIGHDTLVAGDAMTFRDESAFECHATTDSNVLLFDLA